MAQPSLSSSTTDLSGIEPAKPAWRRFRWYLVALLVIGGVVNYLDRSNLSIANTTIAGEFGLTSTDMGLLLAAFSWPYAVANLPAGYLVDRFGPKRMYAWAAGCGPWYRWCRRPQARSACSTRCAWRSV
jgi:sugar phosphate permease